MYQNNNNNNNNNKILRNKKIKSKRQKMVRGTDGERREDIYIFFFSLFSDLRKSDSRFFSEQKAKLIYATRATRRYQKISISSNSKR